LKTNCWAVGQLLQSSSSIPNSCCCNLLLAIPCHDLNLLPLPLVVIVGGNSVVVIRAMLVVQREMGD